MPRKKGAHDATRRGRGGEEKFVAPISQPTTTLLSRSRIRSLQPKRFQFFLWESACHPPPPAG